MLDPARNELGRITLAVASQVNSQHREGMDLTGALGGDFFNVGG
jgi:flagellar hook-associated protein 1 FlgK